MVSQQAILAVPGREPVAVQSHDQIRRVRESEMNYIDLFHGILGFSLGAFWADMHFENHYVSDIEPFAVDLARQRFPDSIQLGDIRNHKEWKLEPGEYIITGGFPCQPFSVAGLREGKGDDRYLWPAMFGVVQKYKPTWLISENVTAIDGMALEDVLSDLGSIGYETAPPLEIPAVAVGAFHERFRIWIIAHADREGESISAEHEGDTQGRLDSTYSTGDDVQRSLPQQGSNGQQIGATFVPNAWETWEGILPESAVCRANDGIPSRVDRTRGLGNAIVPQIAELLFRQIKELL